MNQVKYEKIDIDRSKRVIAISDIHGSLELLQKLLAKIQLTNEDILVIVGDLLEKGNDSLGCLRYMMEMSLKQTVYFVMGNCDDILFMLRNRINLDAVKRYAIWRYHSIINEMCKEIGTQIDNETDMNSLVDILENKYKAEFDFICDLPHVIETQDFIFTHAGYAPNQSLNVDYEEFISLSMFMNYEWFYEKYMVVGHMPLACYGGEHYCLNPIVDEEKKKIAVDGGNVIKGLGQINALIMECKDKRIEFKNQSVDNLVAYQVLKEQQINKGRTFATNYEDKSLEIVEDKESYKIGYSEDGLIAYSNSVWSDKQGEMHGEWTNYFLEVNKGDIVYLAELQGDICLAKKDGRIGWIKSTILKRIL